MLWYGTDLQDNSSADVDLLLKVIYFGKHYKEDKEKALLHYFEEPFESDLLVGVDENRRFYSLVSKNKFPIDIQVKDVVKLRSVSMYFLILKPKQEIETEPSKGSTKYQ